MLKFNFGRHFYLFLLCEDPFPYLADCTHLGSDFTNRTEGADVYRAHMSASASASNDRHDGLNSSFDSNYLIVSRMSGACPAYQVFLVYDLFSISAQAHLSGAYGDWDQIVYQEHDRINGVNAYPSDSLDGLGARDDARSGVLDVGYVDLFVGDALFLYCMFYAPIQLLSSNH